MNPESGGNIFLRIVDVYLQVHTVFPHTRPTLTQITDVLNKVLRKIFGSMNYDKHAHFVTDNLVFVVIVKNGSQRWVGHEKQ
jgi:hypothetical protein